MSSTLNYTEMFRKLSQECGELCRIENCKKRATRLCIVTQECTGDECIIITCYSHKTAFHGTAQKFYVDENEYIVTDN